MSPMVRTPLTIELALMGFLRKEPMHGYEIHRQMSDPDGLGQVWHVKQSQLYALLTKLEENGYIDSDVEAQGSRPPRKVYNLTQQGSVVYLDWLQHPVEHGREMRLNFLVKLFFAQLEGPQIVEQLLSQQRTTCLQWLDLSLQDHSPAGSFKWQSEQFRIGQIRAMLDWLDICQKVNLLS